MFGIHYYFNLMENFTYTFDEKTGILFKNYFGIITIEDIRSSWIYAFENHIIPANIKGFILDYRKATFEMTLDENIEISKFYQQYIHVFRNFKIAILTQNHKDIVIPILVKRNDDGYQSEPFSTLDAAMKWILG